jgi:hypothetical protein
MSLAFALTALAAQSSLHDQYVVDDKQRVAGVQTEVVRLSLPTEGDREAWGTPGLRLQLGYGHGLIEGAGPAWSWRSHGVVLRPSLRLDDRWAIGLGMLYGSGPGGLRWSVTAEPSFLPWRQLAVTVGLGMGGLMVSEPQGRPFAPELVSRTIGADERLGRCDGSAVSALVRMEYLFVAGPLFASGPFAQAEAQWTLCRERMGMNDEDGRRVTLTQWWRQRGATFGWWLAWR